MRSTKEIMRRKFGKLALSIALATAITGGASTLNALAQNSKSSQNSASFVSGLDKASRHIALRPAEAKRIGEKMDAEIRQKYKLSTNQSLNNYVKTVGAKLAANANVGSPIKFTTLDDPKTVNAFAIPGGFIYITTGMIKNLDNESELAAVLGHEIGHVSENHIYARLRNVHGVRLAVGFLGKFLGRDLNTHKVAQLSQYLVLQKFSRRHEYAADKAGAKLMVSAGYNPKGMVTLQDKLFKLSKSKLNLEFLASHPSSAKRRDRIQKYIADNSLDRPNLVINTTKFNAVK